MSVFYIDASVPKPVSEAIAAVRGDVLFAGGPNAPPVSEEDDVWLQRLLVYQWPGIETRACQQAGPYIYGVTWQAFRPLNIPDPSH